MFTGRTPMATEPAIDAATDAATADPGAGFLTDGARWDALVRRDPSADGQFVYSVRTTGVYCRPSCASRLALRRNVAFHLTPAAAEAAGYRPCRRCTPDGPSRAEREIVAVAAACRLIERAVAGEGEVAGEGAVAGAGADAGDPGTPDLATLARAVGLSRFHFHRVFRRVTGVTPRVYGDAQRAGRVRARLPSRPSITEAIFDAGYQSSGSFYAGADHALGMTPARFRRGGAGARIRFAVGQCALGAILVAATDRGVSAIRLGDDPRELVRELQDRFANAELVGDDPSFHQLVATVVAMVESPASGGGTGAGALPLDVQGTAFQHRVWDALRRIPPGTTATYREIAERIGAPRSARAVALACAANPVAVAIPCHRVVRSDGALSGYRWGVERKRELLARERPRAPGQLPGGGRT